jgi:hypothetical protein
VGSLRRRDESLTQGLLLPSVPPLRRLAHRRLLWAYQFVAQLAFVRESWTATVDVERVRPAQDANVVDPEQVEALLGRLEEGSVPLFVFNAGWFVIAQIGSIFCEVLLPVKVLRARDPREKPCRKSSTYR